MAKKNIKNTEVTNEEAQFASWMEEELKEIDDSLTKAKPDELTDLAIEDNPIKRDILLKLLVESREFSSYHTHNNETYAQRVLEELVGVGFIQDILKERPTTSDIGYNGKAMYTDSNEGKLPYARAGEQPYEVERTYFPQLSDEEFDNLKIINHQTIQRLVNHFATREHSKFTSSKPLFNGFSSNLRISATDSSLAFNGVTLSLRVTKPSLALNDKNFGAFAPMEISRLLDLAINAHTSVVLSGETGSGKTETAKYMLNFIDKIRGEPRDKIIIIEDIFEVQGPKLYPEKDILEWRTTGNVSISDHVKNALRNFPRWVVVSETRGEEAAGLLESVLSGAPVITTLHAVNNWAVPSRFVGMVAKAPGDIDIAATKEDFLTYFGIGIHISRKVFSNGKLQRYADEIVKFDPKAPNGRYWPLFDQGFEEYNDQIHRWYIIHPLPLDLKERLRIENNMAPGDIDNEWIPTYEYEEDEPSIIGYRKTGNFKTTMQNGKKYYQVDINNNKIPEYELDENGNRIPVYQKEYRLDENGNRILVLDEENQPIINRKESIFNFNDYK